MLHTQCHVSSVNIWHLVHKSMNVMVDRPRGMPLLLLLLPSSHPPC